MRLPAVGSVTRIQGGVAKGAAWRFYADHHVEWVTGTWDEEFQRLMTEVLSPGDVFYDVGANYGFHTLIGARLVGPIGQAIAFEPAARLHPVLREELALNALDNVIIVGAAVSDRDGEARFFLSRHPGLGSLVEGARAADDEGNREEVRVTTTTLDSWARASRQIPRLVKVDVEGAEAQVIAGAAELMACRRPPMFLVELHGEGPANETIDLFEARGYAYLGLHGRLDRHRIAGLSIDDVEHVVAWHRADPRVAMDEEDHR